MEFRKAGTSGQREVSWFIGDEGETTYLNKIIMIAFIFWSQTA